MSRLSTHLPNLAASVLLVFKICDRHPTTCCNNIKLTTFCVIYAGVFKVKWQKRMHLYVPDMTGFEVLAQREWSRDDALGFWGRRNFWHAGIFVCVYNQLRLIHVAWLLHFFVLLLCLQLKPYVDKATPKV